MRSSGVEYMPERDFCDVCCSFCRRFDDEGVRDRFIDIMRLDAVRGDRVGSGGGETCRVEDIGVIWVDW